MKKIFILGFILFITLIISGCSALNFIPGFGDQQPTDQSQFDFEDRIWTGRDQGCKGHGDYVVINGVCILHQELVSAGISISRDHVFASYSNNIELMDDFVADLSGSTGLAVIPREVFDSQEKLTYENKMTMLNLSSTNDDLTENLIVKLTEDGFFEEVSFKDSNGFQVNINSNPLALEVFGAFTVIIFDVDLGYSYNRDFTQRIWDSLYAGGVYVIHNETGKVFATMTVNFAENVYVWSETNDYTVQTTANVNEPVMREAIEFLYDENQEPVYDSVGNHLYEIIMVPVLDYYGEPLIFETGPILTTIEQIPLFDYYKVLVLDENNEPVLDENGNPVYEEVQEPMLDENGNQVYLEQEVPLLDENGNLQYQENFPVEVHVYEEVTYTRTDYYASISQGPLAPIAQRFVDRIISEYYNWNYYRVHNYQISQWQFAVDSDDIYYMVNMDTNNDSYERVIMRLSFDSETNEILLEEYINATKAGFENCELYIDPVNSNIICRIWDTNIKIFSRTKGLVTIPNTENFQPVVFPNGELFFYTWQDNHVEELGYATRLLHTISAEGLIESRYIELGQRNQVCESETCEWHWTLINMIDGNGESISQNNYQVHLDYQRGDQIIGSGNLKVHSMEAFDSSRPECEENQCWVYLAYDIYDGEQFIGKFEGSYRTYAGDRVPGFHESYNISDGAQIQYLYRWSDIDKLCENEDIGCLNEFHLYDSSINRYGLWLHTREIIGAGEPFINNFSLKDENNAVYNYTKHFEGNVCKYDSCGEYVKLLIYDIDGNKLVETTSYLQVSKNEIMPLYIEYHMSENTEIIMEDELCTDSGCWRGYQALDDQYYSIYYEEGEEMYQTITFADTDRTIVTEETRVSQTCTDINGCNGHEVTYTILDELGATRYEFTNHPWIEYGYRLPYTVTLTMEDINVHTAKENLQEIETCENDVCYRDVSLNRKIGNDSHWIANGLIKYNRGDQIISYIELAEDQLPFVAEAEFRCLVEEGCHIYTNNFTVIDSEGNLLPRNTTYSQSLPVYFNYLDVMPYNAQTLEVTFELSDIEYSKQRLQSYQVFDRIHNIMILEENYYFIPRSNWHSGQENYILKYNPETSQYSAFYTNLPAMHEIAILGNGFVGINSDKTAIYYFEFNAEKSQSDYHFFDVVNLTEGKQINAVNNLIVDFDGSIYFKAVDNFIRDITGTISAERVVSIDTTFTEREIIRLRPIN